MRASVSGMATTTDAPRSGSTAGLLVVPAERRQLVVRVEPDIADRITEARGDVPLQKWLMRAILEKLEESQNDKRPRDA
jgi:hypothetical protein